MQEQGIEIERKFLVTAPPPNLLRFPHTQIEQGYIGSVDNDTEIRIRREFGRRWGVQYFETIKSGAGLQRAEHEFELTLQQYDIRWPQTYGQRLKKTRYEIPQGSKVIELDVYQDDLEGLKVAEVEFPSVESSQDFTPPTWFGSEVTNNKDYKNRRLAAFGIPLNIEEQSRREKNEGFVVELSLEEGVKNLIEQIKIDLDDKQGSLFIQVAGRTSAGKTSVVTAEIIKEFNGDVSILSLDDYSKGNAFIAAEKAKGNKINWDHPDYMDFSLIAQHLEALSKGETIDKPTFSFKTGERGDSEPFKPNKIIIVEGLFALRDEIVKFGDIKVFVDISLHGSIIRRLLRDVQRTNMHPAEILRYYLSVVEPMYQEHIVGTQKNADVKLINEYNPQNEAHRANMYEVQTKFATILDQEALRRAGAEILSTTKQDDFYFQAQDKDLLQSGESVRIRKESGDTSLSYKGPKIGGQVRFKPKFEFKLDPETEKEFFAAYGNAITVIKKHRTLYRLGGTVFSLDRVVKQQDKQSKILGTFIEIRCRAEGALEEVSQICAKLGLDPDQKINSSYFEM